jgi:lysophospholipase L1-like esterase
MKIRQLIKISAIALFSSMVFCPARSQTTIRIMPLGTSMTEGWMDGTELEVHRIAYRKDLKNLLTAAGYNTDFVGSKEYGSADMADYQNAGIDGTRDQYIENMLITGFDLRWSIQETTGPYLDAFNPDVIFLEVGTNDITHDGTPTEPDAIANQRVSAILDQIDNYEARAHKQVMVFLALIINRKKLSNGSDAQGTYTTTLWNQTIEAMAQQRINNGDKIVIVDMENDAGFSYAYASPDFSQTDPEGLHPSAAGYSRMANLWYQNFIAKFNAAPVTNNIPDQTVAEGSAFSAILLDNYVYDMEDADQYVTWTTTQLGGSNLNVNINGSRQASITPKDVNWNGSQTVIFTATDRGKSGINIRSDADTVVFTITATNDAPIITAQSPLSVNEDNSLILSLSNFTVFDPDSDPPTFQLSLLSGTNYTVNGSMVTPALNFAGSLYVNVAVSDNLLQGATYQALITVNQVNDPPDFLSQPDISIDEDNTYTVNIQNFNVSDPDNTLAQLTFVMQPGVNYTTQGNVVTPDQDFNGVLYIESYIRDPLNAVSSSFYLQITVNPLNDPPEFTSASPLTVEMDAQYIYSIKVSDPDPDDVLVVSVPVKPSWMNFYPNSKLLYGVPQSGTSGNNSVSIAVSDGHVNVYQSFVVFVDGPSPVPENEIDTKTFVFPNPSEDHISLNRGGLTGELTFDLFDIAGKPVLHREFCAGCESVIYFSDSEIPPGAYLYRMSDAKKTVTGKLLIRVK